MSPKEIPYTDAQIADQLKGLRGWRHEGGAIRRTYKTDGWPTTLMLVNAIGFYAEAADHHPDLQVSWGSVTVALNTHSAGGITTKDIELARQIEQVALFEAGAPFRPSGKFKRTGS
ncbi:MAG TPA: 4a-hydroxytetrahydrobiopterin dehydratase [Gemmatimonadales bacterium]|nr:4a-hydroxytetrahydrobiopterin dehydratase [Gemmatimonadales bacterium]